jgi:DNA-binding ferritin-like protein
VLVVDAGPPADLTDHVRPRTRFRLSRRRREEPEVTMPPPDDPIAALNEVLSEVIDVVLDVKQAHRKVPETHALHAELDQLFDDLRAWTRLLVDEDEALGVSPLSRMPSVAGRTPPNLWPGNPSDDEVRRVVDEYLERLGQHVAGALAEQKDETARAVLAEVEGGVLAHRRVLAAL